MYSVTSKKVKTYIWSSSRFGHHSGFLYEFVKNKFFQNNKFVCFKTIVNIFVSFIFPESQRIAEALNLVGKLRLRGETLTNVFRRITDT